jgi:hypothetical protein
MNKTRHLLILAAAFTGICLASGCSDPDKRLEGRWVGTIWENGKMVSPNAELELGKTSLRFDTGMGVVWYGTYQTIRKAKPSQFICTLASVDNNGENIPLEPQTKLGAYRFRSLFFNRTLIWNPLDADKNNLTTKRGPVFWGDKVRDKRLDHAAEILKAFFLLEEGDCGRCPR